VEVANLDIVFGLITAHLLGDFFFQSDLMVRNKRDAGVLMIHASLVTAVSYLICGIWISWQILVGVLITHMVIDGIKTLSGKDGPKAFLLDQGAHLAALTAIGVYWIPGETVPYWQSIFPFYTKGLLLVTGAILCVRVGGFWVGKTVAPFQKALDNTSEGLPNAGRLIGQLERALIYLLVLAGEPQGVGFLVTAKSILRFGEIKEPGQQKEAEYIIIGTLMSFSWALFIAFATKALLAFL
jgi:hypothetical protein